MMMMTISDLPMDLESDILSRVPTKSLVELKTTCKRWYTLFKDPKFTKKKKSKAAAAREEKIILFIHPTIYSISFNLHNNTMEFTGKLGSKDLEIYEIFHCDGLVLCTVENKPNPNHVVWNPCTGQTRIIKPGKNRYKGHDDYVLGYGNESFCPSYKILRFCFHHIVPNPARVEIVEFEMYDFSTDSWRVLDGDLKLTQKWDSLSKGVSLRGDAYWVTIFDIIRFDFTTERFEYLPLPYRFPRFGYNVVLSVVREEKLALLCQEGLLLTREIEIWVTNKTDATKELSWSKFLVTFFDARVSRFCLDVEKKVAVCYCRNTIDVYGDRHVVYVWDKIYIVGEGLHKQVYEETINELRTPHLSLLSYVPSLVDIQNDTIERKQKEEKQIVPGWVGPTSK